VAPVKIISIHKVSSQNLYGIDLGNYVKKRQYQHFNAFLARFEPWNKGSREGFSTTVLPLLAMILQTFIACVGA
jgi:hypothetical protein